MAEINDYMDLIVVISFKVCTINAIFPNMAVSFVCGIILDDFQDFGVQYGQGAHITPLLKKNSHLGPK